MVSYVTVENTSGVDITSPRLRVYNQSKPTLNHNDVLEDGSVVYVLGSDSLNAGAKKVFRVEFARARALFTFEADFELESALKTGVFLDSKVRGLRYTTSSGVTGTTNDNGEFQYNGSDSITFYVGGVNVGTIEADVLVSVLQLPYTEQVSSFLQSVDSDNNPENGITITESVNELFESSTITISQVDPDNSDFMTKYKAIMGVEFTTDPIASFDHSKLAIALELLKNTAFYDYYTGDISVFNSSGYNSEALRKYSSKRLELYYFNHVIFPQLQLRSKRIWNEYEGIMNGHAELSELYTKVGEVVSTSIALNGFINNIDTGLNQAIDDTIDLNILDVQFTDVLFNHSDKAKLQVIRDAAVSNGGLWAVETALDSEEVNQLLSSLPDELVLVFKKEAKLLYSCIDAFTGQGFSSCYAALGQESIQAFNNAYAAWEIAGSSEDLNTNTIVHTYLADYFAFAGDMRLLYNKYGAEYNNKNDLIDKIAAQTLVESWVWFVDYRFDRDAVKNQIAKYIVDVKSMTDSMIDDYSLQYNLAADVATADIDVDIHDGMTSIGDDSINICFKIHNNSHFDNSPELFFDIKSPTTENSSLGSFSRTIDGKKNISECTDFVLPPEILGAITTTPAVVTLTAHFNHKVATDSQVLEFSSQNIISELMLVKAPPVIRVMVSYPIEGVIHLDASQSSVHASQGSLSYQWEQVMTAQDPVVELIAANQDKSSFIAPELAEGQQRETLYFNLDVTTVNGHTSSKQIKVILLPEEDKPLFAIYGRDGCVFEKGRLSCWGELGNYSSYVPFQALIPSDMQRPSKIAISQAHGCVIDNADLFCWGSNYYGESDVPEDITNVTNVTVARNSTCAIARGRVSCWGAGNYDLNLPPISLVNPKAVAMGAYNYCAIDNSSVVCWGSPHSYLNEVPTTISAPTGISVGNGQACAIEETRVICWGRYNSLSENAPTNLTNARQIQQGMYARSACVLDDDGIHCWGEDEQARLIEEDLLVNPSYFEGNAVIGCAIDDKGRTCWDHSDKNINGNASDIPPSLTSPTDLAVADGAFCVKDNGIVKCWGPKAETYFSSTVPVGSLSGGAFSVCAIDDEKPSCFDPYINNTEIPSGLVKTTQIVVEANHGCAIDDNQVKCWGLNDDGQINVPNNLQNPKQLALGRRHTCVIDDNGVSCWGRIENAPQGINNPTQLVATYNYACVLDDDTVKCWGADNFGGRLNVPELTNPKLLSKMGSNACAIDDNGLHCWGTITTFTALTNFIEPYLIRGSSTRVCVIDKIGILCYGYPNQLSP